MVVNSLITWDSIPWAFVGLVVGYSTSALRVAARVQKVEQYVCGDGGLLARMSAIESKLENIALAVNARRSTPT